MKRNQLRPVKALMFYENNEESLYYVEEHEIIKDGESFKMAAGAPLKKSTMRAIAKEFGKTIKKEAQTKEFQHCKLFTPNILFNSPHILVWHTTYDKAFMYFDKKLNIPNGWAKIPPLIFAAEKNSLSVYAYKSKDRPTEETELFFAPFHNVHSNCSICLGVYKTKEKPTDKVDLVVWWEKVFWSTIFTELHHTEYDGNINLLWKELVNAPDKPFPLKNLKSTNKTLWQVIKSQI